MSHISHFSLEFCFKLVSSHAIMSFVIITLSGINKTLIKTTQKTPQLHNASGKEGVKKFGAGGY